MADYHSLRSAADFEALVEKSHTERVAILKHSTTCPVSSLAKARIDRALATDSLSVPVYLLDLLRFRSVSALVAESLAVRHESPQLIVVESGRAVQAASHLAIDPAAIVPATV